MDGDTYFAKPFGNGSESQITESGAPTALEQRDGAAKPTDAFPSFSTNPNDQTPAMSESEPAVDEKDCIKSLFAQVQLENLRLQQGMRLVKLENTGLHDRNGELERQLEGSTADNDKLRAQCNQLIGQRDGLRAQVGGLQLNRKKHRKPTTKPSPRKRALENTTTPAEKAAKVPKTESEQTKTGKTKTFFEMILYSLKLNSSSGDDWSMHQQRKFSPKMSEHQLSTAIEAMKKAAGINLAQCYLVIFATDLTDVNGVVTEQMTNSKLGEWKKSVEEKRKLGAGTLPKLKVYVYLKEQQAQAKKLLSKA